MRLRRPRIAAVMATVLSALVVLTLSATQDDARQNSDVAPEPGAGATSPMTSTPTPTASPTPTPTPSPSPTPTGMPATTSPEGFQIALGHGPVVGTDGPLQRYTVELGPGTQERLDDVVDDVRAALEDTDRGWTATGEMRLQWVGDRSRADIRVVLAVPGTVDRYCAERDLDTNGYYSCWDGQRAMLNLDRWRFGVAHFGEAVAVYRTYLVNHEVGHGLGFVHVECPGTGATAPVMMQQTRALDGCLANGWPNP